MSRFLKRSRPSDMNKAVYISNIIFALSISSIVKLVAVGTQYINGKNSSILNSGFIRSIAIIIVDVIFEPQNRRRVINNTFFEPLNNSAIINVKAMKNTTIKILFIKLFID